MDNGLGSICDYDDNVNGHAVALASLAYAAPVADAIRNYRKIL